MCMHTKANETSKSKKEIKLKTILFYYYCYYYHDDSSPAKFPIFGKVGEGLIK